MLPAGQKATTARLEARRSNRIAVGSKVTASNLDRWLKERSSGFNGSVSQYVHLKFLLIDPLGKDPIIITGSANFSDESTLRNDENTLVIRGDSRVANIYLLVSSCACMHIIDFGNGWPRRRRKVRPTRPSRSIWCRTTPGCAHTSAPDGRRHASARFLREARWVNRPYRYSCDQPTAPFSEGAERRRESRAIPHRRLVSPRRAAIGAPKPVYGNCGGTDEVFARTSGAKGRAVARHARSTSVDRRPPRCAKTGFGFPLLTSDNLYRLARPYSICEDAQAIAWTALARTMPLNLSQVLLFAASAGVSLAAPSAPVVEWEYSISASEQAQPIDFVPHGTVVLDDGRVASFGRIPGSASLAAASAMPGEDAARIHGDGDGLSYGGLVDLALNTAASGVALQATHEDLDGVRTRHLAYWEPAGGFRWVQPLEWSQALRSVVLTDDAVVTTFGDDSSVDAYSRIDGHLLWGRDLREFGPFGGGRVFAAGGELYLWLQAFAGFDQPADVSRLLHLDADTGATLWSTDLPRSPGMYFDSIIAINAGTDGLFLTSKESALGGPSQIRVNLVDPAGASIGQRIVYSGTPTVEEVRVSVDRTDADDSVAIAVGMSQAAAVMLVDRKTMDVRWTHESADEKMPIQIWNTEQGVLTNDRTQLPGSPGIVRLRSNADGAFHWTHVEPLVQGELRLTGNAAGGDLILPIRTATAQVRTVRIDLATGLALRDPAPEMHRRREPTTDWLIAGSRALNGGIDGSHEEGSTLTTVAVDVDSGQPLWRRDVVVAAPPWAPTSATGLNGASFPDHVLAWTALQENPNSGSNPMKLVAGSFDIATGELEYSTDRSIAPSSAAVVPVATGGIVAGYEPCTIAPCNGGFILERIGHDGQSRWVEDTSMAGYLWLRPTTVNQASVYVMGPATSGQSFGIGARSLADGQPEWLEHLPATWRAPVHQAISSTAIQFRGFEPTARLSFVGRREASTGALEWRSDVDSGSLTFNHGAQFTMLDGSWLTSIGGPGRMRWLKFAADGLLLWSHDRPMMNSRGSVRRFWQFDDDTLLAEVGISTNGYFRRALLNLDVHTGAILRERLVDAFEEVSAFGRSRPTSMVDVRPQGDSIVVAAVPAVDGAMQYLLQGWSAPPPTEVQAISLAADPDSLSNGRLTALGRVSRVVLRLTRQPTAVPARASLTTTSSLPISVRLRECRLVGGSCNSSLTRQSLPLALTLGEGGEIELEVELRHGVDHASSGTVDFHLDPDFDVREDTLSDNDVRLLARFGAFASGFE